MDRGQYRGHMIFLFRSCPPCTMCSAKKACYAVHIKLFIHNIQNYALMSLKYQPGSKVQAVIDSLKKEHPDAAIETLSYDFDSYDMILEHDSAVYIIGIKLTRANIHTVFKLLLYGKAVAQRYSSKRVYIKLYAPSITTDAKAALARSKGMFHKMGAGKPKSSAGSPVKITSPASWKVICYFLKNDESTINRASVVTGVSYPWTRSVVRKLIDLGAFEEKSKGVKVSSLDELFKHVAWERPINSLKCLEFRSRYEDEREALHELYSNVEGIIPHSSCALFTAADMYLEGAATGGCIQLYADQSSALMVKSLMGEGDGVSFQIYDPDREFDEVYEIDDIRAVSPEQTILDLAGLGSAGADSAKVLTDWYKSRQVLSYY